MTGFKQQSASEVHLLFSISYCCRPQGSRSWTVLISGQASLAVFRLSADLFYWGQSPCSLCLLVRLKPFRNLRSVCSRLRRAALIPTQLCMLTKSAADLSGLPFLPLSPGSHHSGYSLEHCNLRLRVKKRPSPFGATIQSPKTQPIFLVPITKIKSWQNFSSW